MGDKLKEFYSGTLTAANIVSGNKLQLITNNATTQAVVKDIQVVSSTGFQTVALYSGEFKVDDGINSLAGSELVEVSKNFEYRLTPSVPSTYSLSLAEVIRPLTGSETTVVRDILGSFSVLNDYPLQGVDLVPVTTVFNTGSSVMYYFKDITDYWYSFRLDGNSTTTVHRSGLNDNQMNNQLPSISSYMHPCIDFAGRKIYWTNGYDGNTGQALYYSYNMANFSTTLHYLTNSFATTAGTYTRSVFANGFVFTLLSQSYETTLYFYNIASNTMGSLSVPNAFFVDGANVSLYATFNTAEGMYYFLNSNTAGNAYKIWKIASGFTHGNSLTYVGNTGLGQVPFQGLVQPESFNDGFIVYRINGGMARAKFTAGGITDQTSYSINLSAGRVARVTPMTVTQISNPIDLSVNLKVVGIEITP